MMRPDDPHSAEYAESLIARHRRDARRKAILLTLLVIAAFCGAAYLFLGDLVMRAWREQRQHDAQIERMARMTTLEQVHRELLPAWIIAASNAHPDAETRYDALRQALSDDPVAVELLEEWRALLSDPEALGERGEALLSLVKRWNARLDAAGKPWWVDANLIFSPQRPLFYIKTYQIIADMRVEVDPPHSYRTRITARADHTNVVESLLGHTSPHQDGAIILTDRIDDFTMSRIWLLLQHEALPESAPAEARAFAPRVRQELLALLPPESTRLLTDFAPTRRALEETLTQIRARRECGSRFSIAELPWDGFPQDELRVLKHYAERDRYADCPAITEAEAELLVQASEQLREEEALRPAAEQLVALVARPIIVHEARHSADHARADAFDTPLPCQACDEAGLSRAARAELSAYLASFASADLPYTALYQTCTLDRTDATPHAAALRFLLPRLQVDCESAPPDTLQQLAKAQELELFGRSDTVRLPEDYPARLTLIHP